MKKGMIKMGMTVLLICTSLAFLCASCGNNGSMRDGYSERTITSDTGHDITAITIPDKGNGSTAEIQNPIAPSTVQASTESTAPSGKQGESEVLKGKTICIDPGHQSRVDSHTEPIAPSSGILKVKNPGGAVGVYTKIPEYKLNLEVSEKLKTIFEKHGAVVVMTRDSNEVNMGNVERATIANDSKADLFIRIHADSSSNSSVKGISVLIPGNEYVKDTDILDRSRKAADKVIKSLVEITGAKSRGVIERNDLTGFNWAKVPMLLVEMGFMSNPGEDRLINTDEYQDKIAESIVDGVAKYFSGE